MVLTAVFIFALKSLSGSSRHDGVGSAAEGAANLGEQGESSNQSINFVDGKRRGESFDILAPCSKFSGSELGGFSLSVP